MWVVHELCFSLKLQTPQCAHSKSKLELSGCTAVISHAAALSIDHRIMVESASGPNHFPCLEERVYIVTVQVVIW